MKVISQLAEHFAALGLLTPEDEARLWTLGLGLEPSDPRSTSGPREAEPGDVHPPEDAPAPRRRARRRGGGAGKADAGARSHRLTRKLLTKVASQHPRWTREAAAFSLLAAHGRLPGPPGRALSALGPEPLDHLLESALVRGGLPPESLWRAVAWHDPKHLTSVKDYGPAARTFQRLVDGVSGPADGWLLAHRDLPWLVEHWRLRHRLQAAVGRLWRRRRALVRRLLKGPTPAMVYWAFVIVETGGFKLMDPEEDRTTLLRPAPPPVRWPTRPPPGGCAFSDAIEFSRLIDPEKAGAAIRAWAHDLRGAQGTDEVEVTSDDEPQPVWHLATGWLADPTWRRSPNLPDLEPK
jgi:hypothetical protein